MAFQRLWLWTGGSDGHAYDSGFLFSTMLAHIPRYHLWRSNEQIQIHKQMKQMGARILANLFCIKESFESEMVAKAAKPTMDSTLNAGCVLSFAKR